MNDSHRELFDPSTVNRASALGLAARKVVEGVKVGEHRSKLKGFALEFAQHREYVPGDDAKHLDWKMFARKDKLFVKQYEQDTNFIAHILLDASGSMSFASEKHSKFHYAKVLAASLAHVILRQSDAVSVGMIGNGAPFVMPYTDTKQKLPWIMETLARAETGGDSSVGDDLLGLAPQIKSRSIIIIFSDLLNDEESFLKALSHLQYKKSEIIVLQLLDDAEINLPYESQVRFEGLEGEAPLTTYPKDFAETYRAEVAKFCRKIRLKCESYDVHYVLVNTSKPLGEVLGEYLSFRRRVYR